MSCALHVHRWGSPWSDHYKVIPLSSAQLKLVFEACEKLDANLLAESDVFSNVREAIEAELSVCPILFFKLSSASCKDVAGDDFGPPFKINSLQRLLKSLVYSFRIMSEIEDEWDPEEPDSRRRDDYALALRSWSDDIQPDTEYRLLVVERKLEAVIQQSTGTFITGEVHDLLNEYVDLHSSTFPEPTLAMDVYLKRGSKTPQDVGFIEFNPCDEELDTFEADLSTCSPQLHAALKRESTRHWLTD